MAHPSRFVSCVVEFSVHYVTSGPEEVILLVGSLPQLGGWTPQNAPPMVSCDGLWHLQLELGDKGTKLCEFEYKYVVYDRVKEELVRWEKGRNRQLSIFLTEGVAHRIKLEDRWECVGATVRTFTETKEDELPPHAIDDAERLSAEQQLQLEEDILKVQKKSKKEKRGSGCLTEKQLRFVLPAFPVVNN